MSHASQKSKGHNYSFINKIAFGYCAYDWFNKEVIVVSYSTGLNYFNLWPTVTHLLKIANLFGKSKKAVLLK